MSTLAIWFIRFYRYLLSPFLKVSLAGGWWGCRYVPTCQAYCRAAVRQYGLRAGSVLFLKRLSRCHPWTPGGYDPVPEPNGGSPDTPPPMRSGKFAPRVHSASCGTGYDPVP